MYLLSDDDEEESVSRKETVSQKLFDPEAVPNWDEMRLEEIYDAINPGSKEEKERSSTWKTCCLNVKGGSLQLGTLGKQLLKALVKKNSMSNTTLNHILQTKKEDRNFQRMEFMVLNDADHQLIRTFLHQNIIVPKNADGDIVSLDELSLNEICRALSLANESESYTLLSQIFSTPKGMRRIAIDDPLKSYDQMWSILANDYVNNPNWKPENSCVKDDSRLTNIDPTSPPTLPWTSSKLRIVFRTYKTYFGRISTMFTSTGRLAGGNSDDLADRRTNVV